MDVSIKGLVERLELSPPKAMMPLFEAISNAIDAVTECGDGYPKHCIKIKLVASNDLATEAGDDTVIIDGFDISDDGIGFNDENTASFRKAFTLSKVKLGGKGVGRFTYLKVFPKVHIRSVFQDREKKYLREFEFSVENELKGYENIKETTEAIGTVVSMRSIAAKYKKHWSNDPEIIAIRIIEHFLICFASRSCPKIILESPTHAPIDLHRLFQSTVLTHIEEKSFQVEGHFFSLQAYRHHDARLRHDLHLCANGRSVTKNKLRDILPELPDRLIDEEQRPYTLIVLVTGEYLDDHSNQERTKISFQSNDEPDLDDTLISRQKLNEIIAETLRPLLSEDLKSTNEEKRQQIEKFVENAPEYRSLMHSRYQSIIEQRIQPGLSKEKLDEELLHVKREIEDSVKKEVRHVAALFETESFEQYQERFKKVADEANEIGKAQLAAYVAHRRTILDLVGHGLRKQRSDERYPLEKVLHKMVFPMGVDSREIFFEQQNLWIIDERLAYHTLLTSDKKMNSVKGLKSTSGKEPDIFAFFYDTPIGISEPNDMYGGGVVIIEFKRPGRDDYDKDPADQIIQRFREISEGNVTDIDGRIVNPANLRYTGYLIADLTKSLHRQVFGRYNKTSDNEGYFYNLAQGNGYIEIISYDKLIRDAERRNRILFDKLGLHKNNG